MIRPLHDFVLIKPDEAKDRSDGGIFIPVVAQEKTFRGTVLSVGEGYWDSGHFVEPVVCPGDRVLYAKYDGNEIELEGEKFLLIKEAAIFAVLEPQSTGDGSSKPWVGEEAKQLSKKEQAALKKLGQACTRAVDKVLFDGLMRNEDGTPIRIQGFAGQGAK
jgi:chaperonin GroES